MKKKGFLLDLAVGFALTAIAILGYLQQWAFFAGLEYKAYDFRAKFRQSLKSPTEIALVTIDDEAISQIGRWPWPRSKVAEGLDKIAAAGPKVIGLNVLFSEPEQSLGLAEVRRLEDKYKELLGARKIVQKPGADFALEFASSTVALDSDSRLLESVQRAGVVVMPVFFAPNDAHAAAKAPPVEVSSAAVGGKPPADPALLSQDKMIWPLPALAGASSGLGHSNFFPESDGVFRRDAPLIQYAGALYPSYALRLAMAYQGVKPSEVRLVPGQAVTAGPIRVPLDDEDTMAVTFIGPANATAETIKRVSFASVLNGTVAPEFFKDKIVLIGHTALGVGNSYATPAGPTFPGIEIVAHILENILHRDFLTRPEWAFRLELGSLAVIGLFIMFVLPRLRALWGLVVSLLLSLLIMGAGMYFFIVPGEWIKVGYPLALLLGGYLVVISKGFLVTEKGKELVEASAIETNKMLGLSFQGQGMLDLAFEKFRLCPLDDNMKDTLYSLALDFERKRQYSKAAAVLDHVAAKDPKYKDAVEKAKKLKEASDGAVFGGVGAKKEGTVLITGGATKPTLGRYEIEKELGRGAMGVVYLGRDPKINRMVAIKTMMLEEGSDGSDAKEVKERFFREAESAGTLNHPNIVRIFDAGEENEVAYIAMELLDGQDLTKNCAKGALLPAEKAVEYAATVADALDYAHKQGIVHRDIKPANIMLLKDGSIRVADFGIARIAASSKTATGTVMGTPSYMSPEQVAGRKVDGRSDLFSLTVALYELLTGEKPFKGGEGIGTLLFQIANDPTPDIRDANPAIPAALKAVIDKGLAKSADERYQRGSELAAALRVAMKDAPAAPATAAAVPPPPAAKTAPTVETTVPESPAPVVPLKAASDRTAKFVDLPELDEMLNAIPSPVPTAPAPKPAPRPAPEKTAAIVPDITIPGLNDAPAPAPAPAEPPPPAEATAPTMSIELGGHAGVGSSVPPPPPPPADGASADATMRIEPTQNFDATLRIKPHPQEPS